MRVNFDEILTTKENNLIIVRDNWNTDMKLFNVFTLFYMQSLFYFHLYIYFVKLELSDYPFYNFILWKNTLFPPPYFVCITLLKTYSITCKYFQISILNI